MNAKQIHSCLKKYPQFIGVFASNEIPNPLLIQSPPIAMVINTDPNTKPGSHWICIFVTKNGFGHYFDSYALPPSLPSVLQFLNRYCGSQWSHNTRRLQGNTSATCGHYVVDYLLHQCCNLPTYIFFRKFKINNYDYNDALIAKTHNAKCTSKGQTCKPLL